jgi:hypothetical protein
MILKQPETRGHIMNAALVNILFQALTSVPNMIGDIETIARANWAHPVLADAKQGISMLSNLVNDIGQTPPTAVASLSAVPVEAALIATQGTGA